MFSGRSLRRISPIWATLRSRIQLQDAAHLFVPEAGGFEVNGTLRPVYVATEMHHRFLVCRVGTITARTSRLFSSRGQNTTRARFIVWRGVPLET